MSKRVRLSLEILEAKFLFLAADQMQDYAEKEWKEIGWTAREADAYLRAIRKLQHALARVGNSRR